MVNINFAPLREQVCHALLCHCLHTNKGCHQPRFKAHFNTFEVHNTKYSLAPSQAQFPQAHNPLLVTFEVHNTKYSLARGQAQFPQAHNPLLVVAKISKHTITKLRISIQKYRITKYTIIRHTIHIQSATIRSRVSTFRSTQYRVSQYIHPNRINQISRRAFQQAQEIKANLIRSLQARLDCCSKSSSSLVMMSQSGDVLRWYQPRSRILQATRRLLTLAMLALMTALVTSDVVEDFKLQNDVTQMFPRTATEQHLASDFNRSRRNYNRNAMNQSTMSHVESNLPTCSKDIRSGNLSYVLAHAADPNTDFSLHLRSLIRLAYGGDAENTASVMSFVKKLKFMSHISIAYCELVKEMNTSNNRKDMLWVASSIKSVIDSPKFEEANHNDRLRLQQLKFSFINAVKYLLWSEVCLQNVNNKLYLYSIERVYYDVGPNTTRPVNANLPVPFRLANRHWKFETSNEGRSFTIRNTKVNEYLFSKSKDPDWEGDPNFGVVYSLVNGRKNDKSEWRIEILGSNTIRMENVSDNSTIYLQGGASSNHWANVYTSKDVDPAISEFKVLQCD